MGYYVKELLFEIKRILGLNREWRMGIVGVGNLGLALLSHENFVKQGYVFVAAFDNDPQKIAKKLPNGLVIHHINDLPWVAKNTGRGGRSDRHTGNLGSGHCESFDQKQYTSDSEFCSHTNPRSGWIPGGKRRFYGQTGQSRISSLSQILILIVSSSSRLQRPGSVDSSFPNFDSLMCDNPTSLAPPNRHGRRLALGSPQSSRLSPPSPAF